MSEWCFQCGVAQKPERAVGVDEDGEPACALHRVKAERPFDLPAPIELPPIKLEPIVPARKEVALETKDKRTCSCGCGAELRSRWPYLKGHNKQPGGGPILSAPKKKRKYTREPKPPCAPEIFAEALGGGIEGSDSQTSERVIILQLGESKVQKLLDLLLQ